MCRFSGHNKLWKRITNALYLHVTDIRFPFLYFLSDISKGSQSARKIRLLLKMARNILVDARLLGLLVLAYFYKWLTSACMLGFYGR